MCNFFDVVFFFVSFVCESRIRCFWLRKIIILKILPTMINDFLYLIWNILHCVLSWYLTDNHFSLPISAGQIIYFKKNLVWAISVEVISKNSSVSQMQMVWSFPCLLQYLRLHARIYNNVRHLIRGWNLKPTYIGKPTHIHLYRNHGT